MNLAPPTATKGLGKGTTKGLAGGASRRTGQQGYTQTRNRRTAGMTTTSGKTAKDSEEWQMHPDGVKIYVKPKALMTKHVSATQEESHIAEADTGSQQATSQVESLAEGDSKKKADDEKKKKESMSIHSQLSSSLMETSEDEERKKKEEADAKKRKKGLSQAELDADVDVNLKETKTVTFLIIKQTAVNQDTEEHTQCTQDNKDYDILKQAKIGSDSYMNRGSQTLNLTQKVKSQNYKGFIQETKEVTASRADIDDASKEEKITNAKKQENAYLKSINDIMADKLKNPNSLFDAEALASHISIVTSQSQSQAVAKSGSNMSETGGGGSKSKKKSSQSGVGQSKADGQTSDVNSSSISGSMNKTNQQFNTGTTGQDKGVFGNVAKVEYSQDELPASIMKAIRIINRLLTQSKFHEQHVLYMNYPPVDIVRKDADDDEDNNDPNANRMMPGFGGGDKKKKEEEKVEELENKEDDDSYHLIPLFKFKCDLTQGRQVSCIDINSINSELIAVSYGEFDIDCTQNLQRGILAFWTLKNPSFPEKIIYSEHSITCCQFSKKSPHMIAVGDSHGNIAIYNIRSDDYATPIAESKDIDGKHTDIIWELQWVDRDAKGEGLVTISGDGRIIEWTMKKGLEFLELTQLKRETNPNQKDVYSTGATEDKGEKKGGMTFITTGGLSIDFPKGESTIYYAATEDCSIHKCSVSYPDQYLENYYGHAGPIYRIRCNPFWNAQDCPIFLSCSYDWTVRVWHAKEFSEKLVCQQMSSYPLKAQVNDIEWSPRTSSRFASVSNDGRIEIWDLFIDPLNPLITHFDKDSEDNVINTPKTIVRFGPEGPSSQIILSGNLEGEIDVYRSKGLEHVEVTDDDQQKRLLNALSKDDFSADTKDKKADEGDVE